MFLLVRARSTTFAASCRRAFDAPVCLSGDAAAALGDASVGPQRCAEGFFSAKGVSLACELCPPGHSCEDPAALESCAPGTYAPYGGTNCSACPAGFKCLDPADPPVACDAGTYAFRGRATCTSCARGYVCRDGLPPVLCEPGWRPTANQTSCAPCPPGERFYSCGGTVTFLFL